MTVRILRLPEVKIATGYSRSHIYLLIKEKMWPEQLPIGKRMIGWPASEVEALTAARIAGKTDQEIKALVLQLMAARKIG